MRPADHFTAGYAEGRDRFLRAAEAAGALTSRYESPARGPEGEALTTDCAWVGPREASRLLVTLSGTHGTEGPCGSGVQVGRLERGLWKELPADTAALLVHAVNPFGFAHLRRETEENVDLNRNFLDFAGPLPENPGYDALHPLLCPDSWDEATLAETGAALEAYRREHGPAAFQQALSGGQYRHADGLFFGGEGPTRARRALEAIFDALPATVRAVAVVDYHTGLGPYGHGERIVDHPLGTPEYARAEAWYGGDVTSPDTGTSTSAPLVGTNGRGIVGRDPGRRYTWIALEYGTQPLDRVFGALRARNWLWRRGEWDSPRGREIRAELRACFAPEDPAWRDMVWDRGLETERLALKGLTEE